MRTSGRVYNVAVLGYEKAASSSSHQQLSISPSWARHSVLTGPIIQSKLNILTMTELPRTKTGDTVSTLTPPISGAPSPDGTAVDVDAICKEKHLDKKSIDELLPPSTKSEVHLEAQSQKEGSLTKLSPSRKWFLLLVFSVAQVGTIVHCFISTYADDATFTKYLDVCSVSALFVLTDAIQKDLGIQYEASSWIIVSWPYNIINGPQTDLYITD